MSLWIRLSCVVLVSCLWVSTASAWNPQVLGGRCKQTGNSCSGTIGNRGQSRGSCCDPAASNIITCASQNPCIGGRAYKWAISNLPLSWYFNPNGMVGKNGFAGLSEAQIIAAMKRGWDAWSSQGCTSFAHNYQGKTSNSAQRGDKQLVLFMPTPAQWAQFGAGTSTLAFTMPAPNNNGELLDGDIVYNPSPRGGWGIGNKTDLVGVTAHEAGHAIGFAHDARSSSLMFYAHTGNFSTLPKDDRDAVCFTYPGSCTTDANCGGCMRCVGGKCVRKTINQIAQLCKPCNSSSDCGGPSDLCIRLESGQRCVQACDAAGCCPVGYRCSDIGSGQVACLPDIGKCADARCTSDANCGPGEQCTSGVCKPKPVPADPKLCRTCQANTDCGGKNVCFTFPDGQGRCAMPCSADLFCPTGYQCQSQSGGRFCFPTDFVCTCTSNADCATGEICQNGACRPSSCKYGCACSDKVQCDAPYQCYQTGSGNLCFQPCGNSGGGTYPPGSPGGACNNGACTGGANCYNLQNGGNICLKPCTSNANCGTAGRCYQLGGQNFCACQNDNECGGGTTCNKSVLGQSGGGACAAKQAAASCPANFECKDAGGTSICQPKPIRNAGETCSNELACKEGMFCLKINAADSTGICFEDCSQTNKCQFGGACVLPLSGGNKACGCNTDSQCTGGKICLKVLANGQVGYCGAPQYKCGNGTCESTKGENCGNCAGDCGCATGQTCQGGVCKASGPRCGDGTCNGTENCGTCAGDCKCPSGQTCQNNKCAAPPQTCGNGQCDNGETCGSCPGDCPCPTGQTCQNGACAAAPPQTCGNGQCDNGETCGTCAADCPCPTGQTCQNGACAAPPASCGNGQCDNGETCGTCPGDCPCPTGQACQNGLCNAPSTCGDGQCVSGETCSSCPQDCGCTTGQTCQDNKCQASLSCSVADQINECDENGENCKAVCAKPNTGCQCSSQPGQSPMTPLLWLLVMVVGGLALRRRKDRA